MHDLNFLAGILDFIEINMPNWPVNSGGYRNAGLRAMIIGPDCLGRPSRSQDRSLTQRGVAKDDGGLLLLLFFSFACRHCHTVQMCLFVSSQSLRLRYVLRILCGKAGIFARA